MQFKDLRGEKFGLLSPIERVKLEDGSIRWKCICDCGKTTLIRSGNLLSGATKSCGCVRYKTIGEKLHKPIQYEINGDTAICKTASGVKFLVDATDVDKIADRSWTIANGGYVCAKFYGKKEKVGLHRFLLGVEDSNVMVDHKDRNRMNNRRSNLRVCTRNQNAQNYGIRKDNTTGVTGVYKNKQNGKWIALITENHNTHSLGHFDNFDDAVFARREAEKKYFGEFAPLR